MLCWCLYASHRCFLKAGLASFALRWYMFLRLIFVLSWRSSHGRSCRCLVTFWATSLCMIFISPWVKKFQFSLVSLDGAVVMKVSWNEAISLCSSVTLALLYMNIFCTCFLVTLALSRTTRTEQWSLMPVLISTIWMRSGEEEKRRSRIFFPRVGSSTICVKYRSFMTFSPSSFSSLPYCGLGAMLCWGQLISGKLESPATIRFGNFLPFVSFSMLSCRVLRLLGSELVCR